RLTLDLGARWRLVFCNPRKFGRVWLTDRPEEVLAELGPEPLEPAFTAERFLAMLAKRRGRIKALLLDQTFLAGLGNIYADETLHRAAIHPLARACDLPPDRGRALRRSIRAVLHEAIRHRGTTFDDAYGGGEYFDRLRVYQRTGKPCLRCRTPIARILVAQRGTHFCPICQPRRSRGSA
ncbi:MAG: zinc finger domain-containing protein, partial [Candidatus Eisenbacteria bacterium]